MQNFFIGIDISKKTLAVCVQSDLKPVRQVEIANTVAAIKKEIRQWMKTFKVDKEGLMICAEYTGRYIYPLAVACDELDVFLWMEDPTRLKNSMGLTRGKNDKVDARRIAEYSYRYHDHAVRYKMQDRTLESLKNLASDRALLLEDKKKYQAQINDQKGFVNAEDYARKVKSWTKIINAINTELAEIDARIDALSEKNETVKQQMELLTGIDGIGKRTAVMMIVLTNCFTSFPDARKFCIYAGLIPFSYDSGTSVRSRSKVSKRANQQIKSLLHMAALVAATHMKKGELKEYYKRKVAEGKHKMSVLNVVRAKLVERMFAVIRDGRKYTQEYTNKASA